MVELIYTSDFLKSSRKLPFRVQGKLANQLELLRDNPFHPFLHSKSLVGPLTGLYSFRITRDWRVIFCFTDAKIIKLVDVTHRKDIYR